MAKKKTTYKTVTVTRTVTIKTIDKQADTVSEALEGAIMGLNDSIAGLDIKISGPKKRAPAKKAESVISKVVKKLTGKK